MVGRTVNHVAWLSNAVVWIGIAFCISQSAIFSGLNPAIFFASKLRLEVEASGGNADAVGLLVLRKDPNLTLATVPWGNVTINVLLTLLSDSVLAGLGAFATSFNPEMYWHRSIIVTDMRTPLGGVIGRMKVKSAS
jgi:CBS domain containing-hemolysin-like protein